MTIIFDPNHLFYEMAEIFHENYSQDEKVIICNEGSSRCFHSGQKVITSEGSKPISEIQPGEKVLTFNEETKRREFKLVKESLKFNNIKPCLKITLKNGKQILATEDHEFYYKGSWHSLKHIVSLYHESQNKH